MPVTDITPRPAAATPRGTARRSGRCRGRARRARRARAPRSPAGRSRRRAGCGGRGSRPTAARPGSRASSASSSRCTDDARSHSSEKWACSERSTFGSAVATRSASQRCAGGRLLPGEVAELLGGVGVPGRDREDRVEPVGRDHAAGAVEAAADVAAEVLRVDHAELDLLGAAPERLVGVAEDAPHHVALGAEVDVRDLGLGLEDRAHQPRQLRVDVGDLLELVEHERDACARARPRAARAARAGARSWRAGPRRAR